MGIVSGIQSSMNSFLRSIGQYGAILKWLSVDSVWRFKRISSVIVLTGFLGVTFHLSVFGLLLFYARALENGQIIRLLGQEFEAQSSIGLLLLWGSGVFVCLLLSAWLIHFSDSTSLKLGRRYEEFCAKRILSIFGSTLGVWLPSDRELDDDGAILRLARKDARFCGRFLPMLLTTIVPAGTFFVAFGTLLYINTFLTLLVLVLMGVHGFFLYKVNILGIQNSHLKEEHARGASHEYLRIIRRQKGTAVPLPEDESWLQEKIFASGSTKQHMDAYVGRKKAVVNSQFVSNIFFAAATLLILLTLGSTILREGQGWGKLLIYLVALRYASVNLKQVSTKITSMNRLYPQLRRYFQFMKDMETPWQEERAHPVTYTMRVGPNAIEGSIERWDLHKGSRIGLISPVELNRYTLAFLNDCLLGYSKGEAREALESMWFVTSWYECLLGTLRESLGLPRGYNWQDLCKDMEGAGLCEMLKEKLPHNLDTPISPGRWRQIDPGLKMALALVSALRSNCQWVMVEEKGLRCLPNRACKSFLQRLSDRITVIVCDETLETVGQYDEDVVVVINENHVIGLGSLAWFVENRHKIGEAVDRSTSKVSGHISEDVEDELDDDDEM